MPVNRGSAWVEYTWKELVEALRVLLEERAPAAIPGQLDPTRLAHDLQVHQVELEMQNRELREARDAIEATSSRYADLFQNAPVGYAALDAKGVIVEVNLAAASMLRAPRDLLVGLPFAAAARLTEKTAFIHLLREATQKGQTRSADLEMRVGGVAGVMQVTIKPNFGPLGEHLGFLVTAIDIGDRRRAEQERASLDRERHAHAAADAANRMKDEFLGIVSHELRTPLNAVMGWAQVLADRPGELALVGRGLAAIQRNGQALSRIVDDILDVTRIVSGKLQIEKKRIDFSEVVLSALETARAAAQAKRVILTEQVTPQCPLEGDPMRLAQVVSNLVTNAIKFTPEGGSVEVALTAGEQGATLSVRDSGLGIDAADLPYIFETFRQASHSETRANPGLGLGLAIARHLVEAHGGTIEARSEGKGRGALFTVQLPHVLGETLPAREPGPSRTISGVKVLYVDDAVDVLETLALMLEPMGAVVRTARSVDEALPIVQAFHPQVILSDLAMPERDGYDLLRAVRQLPGPDTSIPVIALTAYARAEDAANAVRAGFAGHVGKPVAPGVLASVIASVMPSP